MIRKTIYLGIFLISLAMFLFQVLESRLFSVVIFYHFAFFMISLAMFGLSLGAALVYRKPQIFRVELTACHLGRSALLFGWSGLAAIMLLVVIPIDKNHAIQSALGLCLVVLLTILPFAAGGVCICLGLTRFQQATDRLYAADLAGAACGALTLLLLLPYFNAPALGWVILLLAALAALSFLPRYGYSADRRACFVTIGLAGLVIIFELCRPIEASLFSLHWAKGLRTESPIYERWNSFSRVTALKTASSPYAWGLSNRFPDSFQVEQAHLVIDASASTPITRWDGSLSTLEHLKADIVNIAHYLRQDARVFVIGVGGGRDLLTSLAFNQHFTVGAEVNSHILEAVRKKFYEFTGALFDNPGVEIVNDEARSYIGRNSRHYDIIQMSLVDTWAASSSGAFALAENSLYTVEAWSQFISHLTPAGLFSVSRWWGPNNIGESLRAVSLARAALANLAVVNPGEHLVVLINKRVKYEIVPGLGVMTLLINRSPFGSGEIAQLEKLAADFDFEIAYAPGRTSDLLYLQAVNGPIDELSSNLGLRLDPPTDSAPFFFFFSRLRDVLTARASDRPSSGISLLLIIMVLFLFQISYRFLIRPILKSRSRPGETKEQMLIVYFASIGFGYMFIEMALMQWFAVFLGHPIYGISVCLPALLLGTGLGSLLSRSIADRRIAPAIFLLFLFLAGWGAAIPHWAGIIRQADLAQRLLFAAAAIAPIGVGLGLGFPLGMRVVGLTASAHGELFWAINGAASVCAGALAILAAISTNLWAAYAIGVGCYGFSFVGMALLDKRALEKAPIAPPV